jgi:hypothetical protein
MIKRNVSFVSMSILGILLLSFVLTTSCASPNESGTATVIPSPEKIGGTAAISGDSISYVIEFPPVVSGKSVRGAAIPDNQITGSITLNGILYNITSASYNSSTGFLTASTESTSLISFSLTGAYSSTGVFSGTLTENNSGSITMGSVTGIGTAASAVITNYFGTFTSSASFNGTRTWNLTISDSKVVGTYYEQNTGAGTIIYGTATGTCSGDTINGTFKPTTVSATALSGTLTGTINGSNIAGTWSAISGSTTYTGSWNGTKP